MSRKLTNPIRRERMTVEHPSKSVEKTDVHAAEAGHHDDGLERLGGNRTLIRRIATIFLDGLPRLRADIECSIENADSKTLAFTCHALRGSLGNFSTGRAFAVAGELEGIANSGDLRNAASVYRTLNVELTQLEPSIERLAAG